jgi:phosphate transport system permease protein
MKRTTRDWLLSGATGLAVLLVLAMLGLLVVLTVAEGAPVLSFGFLVSAPSADMTGGGIGPAIYGTVLLTLLMTVAVVPVGVATGVYLTEYASPDSRLARLVRAAVYNLAGVPSIVFGLFGLGFFVLFVGRGLDALVGSDEPLWGQPALLWASLTLAVLTLPTVIVTTEEALRAVPRELREASLALGATRLQSILTVTLPHSRGGILTGVVLAVSRGAGEVAPILFTGAANFLPYLPNDARDMFMHLGYHVYVLATQSPDVEHARPTLFATVLVLLVVTFSLNLVAIVIRARSRGVARV